MKLSFIFLAIVAITNTSCSRQSSIVPVSGVVTLNGKPLAFATVTFQPTSNSADPGPVSQGQTDAEGKYSLVTINTGSPGAVMGKHMVSITAYLGDSPDVTVDVQKTKNVFRKALLPSKYNSATELKFEVPSGGTTTADFALTMD